MSYNPRTWMTDNYETLKDTPFSQITLFGSHDSGMSTVQFAGASPIGSGGITQAQSLSIKDQILLGGVRYLDIRLVYYNPVITGIPAPGYYTAHYQDLEGMYVGWLGQSLPDVINDIASAYSAADPGTAMGAQDVLLIELSHGAVLAGGVDSPLSNTQLKDITAYFTAAASPVAEYLYQDTSSPSFWNLTPRDLAESGKRIFVFAGSDTAITMTTGPIFPKTTAVSYYNSYFDADSTNYLDVIDGLGNSMVNNLKSPDTPLLLAYHCASNPGAEYITLQDLAGKLNPLFTDSVAAWCTSKNAISFSLPDRRVPVIVAADYISGEDLSMLDACADMNLGHYKGIVNFPPPLAIGQSSQQGPAIAWLNDVFYIAWAGTNQNNNLNIMSSTDGISFENPTGPLQPRSTQSPALCACGDTLVIAWTGTDQHLNVSQVQAAGTKITGIASQPSLGQRSPYSPAMAWIDNVLYLAWIGTDNHINLAWSTDCGHSFPDANHYFSPSETSGANPAICAFNGSLWIIWAGKANTQLCVVPVQRSGATVTGLGAQSQPQQLSQYGPAVVAVGATMYIAWVSTNGLYELNLLPTTDGQTYGDKYVSQQASSATPALCTDGQNPYLAWAGTNASHSLNTAQFLLRG